MHLTEPHDAASDSTRECWIRDQRDCLPTVAPWFDRTMRSPVRHMRAVVLARLRVSELSVVDESYRRSRSVTQSGSNDRNAVDRVAPAFNAADSCWIAHATSPSLRIVASLSDLRRGSPKRSRKRDWVRESSWARAARRLARNASARSSTSAIRRCSASGGRGISQIARQSFGYR